MTCLSIKTLRSVREKNTEETLMFITTFNPRNPNVSNILNNAVDLLKRDPVLKQIFGKLKFIKSKREPSSLADLLTKSSFCNVKPKPGVSMCKSNRCKTCPLIVETDSFNFWKVNYNFKIKGTFDCTATDCIYVISCSVCMEYYIGKTVNLRQRMTKHRACIRNHYDRNMFVSKHIYNCGGGFTVVPFYHMKRQGIVAHLTTEDHFIHKFQPSLNMRI